MTTAERYAEFLLNAKNDEDCCCFIGDSGHSGATVLYRGDRWLVIKHFDGNSVATAKEIAIATVNEEADAKELLAAALAADLEDEPLWLVDAKTLDGILAREYGNSLMVLWRSDEA